MNRVRDNEIPYDLVKEILLSILNKSLILKKIYGVQCRRNSRGENALIC